jgi:ribosomal protein S18 acetylase RimI-like enzyme
LADSSRADLVFRLAVAAFEEFRATLVPPPGILAETVEDVAAYIQRGGAVIAWDGDVAVGSARFHREPDHLYVGRVAVPPEFRRRGIASELMRFLETHARSLGLPETRVEVRMALPSNIALYESLGYLPISYQPHPRVPSAVTVKMANRLPCDNPGPIDNAHVDMR